MAFTSKCCCGKWLPERLGKHFLRKMFIKKFSFKFYVLNLPKKWPTTDFFLEFIWGFQKALFFQNRKHRWSRYLQSMYRTSSEVSQGVFTDNLHSMGPEPFTFAFASSVGVLVAHSEYRYSLLIKHWKLASYK